MHSLLSGDVAGMLLVPCEESNKEVASWLAVCVGHVPGRNNIRNVAPYCIPTDGCCGRFTFVMLGV